MRLVLALLALLVPATAAFAQTGSASWYALDGNRTASGERMNSALMTAAHRTLPMGSKIKVTNLHNGKSVVVRINDRGPFAKGRILDVSKGAAKQLGFLGRGHAKVTIAKLGKDAATTAAAPAHTQLAALKTVAQPKKKPALLASFFRTFGNNDDRSS